MSKILQNQDEILVNPNTIREEDMGMFKYVVFNDGSVGFLSCNSMFLGHRDIVREAEEINPDLKPVSAGMIWIKNRDGWKWFVEESGSTSLRLAGGDKDVEILKQVLEGMEYQQDLKWEY